MYIYQDRYNCFNADKFMVQGEYSKIAHEEHKIQNACNSVIKNPENYHYAGDSGISFKTCVCNFYDRQIMFLIGLEDSFNKTSNLPASSGARFLSNKLNNVFNLIRMYKIDYEKAEMEKAKQKSKLKR
jgi:hypothetical protein